MSNLIISALKSLISFKKKNDLPKLNDLKTKLVPTTGGIRRIEVYNAQEVRKPIRTAVNICNKGIVRVLINDKKYTL